MLNELKACVSMHGRVGLSEVEPGLTLSSLGLECDLSSELSRILVGEFLSDIESFTGIAITLEEYCDFKTVKDVSDFLDSKYTSPSSQSEEDPTLTNKDD